MIANYHLKVSGSNLNSFFILEKIVKSSVPILKSIVLPKKTKKFVLLKSPHVNKKSKEHFQLTRYQRLYYINCKSLLLLQQLLLKAPNDLNIVFKAK